MLALPILADSYTQITYTYIVYSM